MPPCRSPWRVFCGRLGLAPSWLTDGVGQAANRPEDRFLASGLRHRGDCPGLAAVFVCEYYEKR